MMPEPQEDVVEDDVEDQQVNADVKRKNAQNLQRNQRIAIINE